VTTLKLARNSKLQPAPSAISTITTTVSYNAAYSDPGKPCQTLIFDEQQKRATAS